MGQQESNLSRIQTPDGRERTFVLSIPDGKAHPSGRALVVMLHGAGGSTLNVIAATRWDQLAQQEGFVVVFPNGTPSDESKQESFLGNPQTWNSGVGTSLAANETSAHAKNIDDVGFIAALIEHVASTTSIDRRQVFIAGHSNGAGMAYRVASERSDLVAAVGVMAGHLAPGLQALRYPVSLIQISGDQDPFAPLEGGLAGTRRIKMMTRPARLNPSDWALANGIMIDQPQTIRDDETARVLQWRSNQAPGSTEVRWIVVRNHGHAWAGGSNKLPGFLMGPKSTFVDATSEMWTFFKSHPKA